MSQARANLLANAVQHVAADIPVWMTVRRQDADVVIVGQNGGDVISPRRLRVMFDPAKSFAMKSTSERSASESSNLGLGLYDTHEIVLAHSSKILVSSTELEKTAIKLQIPQRAAAAA